MRGAFLKTASLILDWLCLPCTPQARGSTRQAALLETRKEIAILRACRDPNIVMFQVRPALYRATRQRRVPPLREHVRMRPQPRRSNAHTSLHA